MVVPVRASSKSSGSIRVLCVDDHRIVREGIALMINRQTDMEVVAAVGTPEEALTLFRRTRPDVTIMDLQLGRASGVDVISAIRRHDSSARIIVLTMFHGDEDIHRALQAGAVTYLLKDTALEDLVRVVRDVHAGRQPTMSAEVSEALAERQGRPTLTQREIEVLELARQGLRNREISATLDITEETVQSHIKNILAKLDVKDRTAAVHVALRRGILHIN